MILGLDISTSIVGFSVLDPKFGSIVLMDYVDLKKLDGIWAKVDQMKNFIKKIKTEYNIDRVFIEEPLSKFSRGKSSSYTISLLMRFNGIVSYLVHQEMGIDPVYYAPSKARKICQLKMRTKGSCKKDGIVWKPQKEQAFEQMASRNEFIDFKWDLKKTGKKKDYCYDMMDSYIIAKAGYIENIGDNKNGNSIS